jgi:hypothetical protein
MAIGSVARQAQTAWVNELRYRYRWKRAMPDGGSNVAEPE